MFGTFSFNKFSEEHCQALCKAWTHRVSFVYGIWVDIGALSAFVFHRYDRVRFAPLPEMQSLVADAAPAFAERMERINSIRPQTFSESRGRNEITKIKQRTAIVPSLQWF